MEPLNNNTVYHKFIKTGLLFLLSTLVFGLIGAIEYAFPGIWRNSLPFQKIRPLHVSSAIFWILITAIGCVLYYLQEHYTKALKNNKLEFPIYILLTITFIAILISYFWGIFGGREYWEFHPIFTIPFTIAWILFLWLLLSNITKIKDQPVYVWMWLTGGIFFLFTYLESNLWLIPAIRNSLIKDMTIQWKSYGSLVGSWNMLIYGSSIYLLDKISGEKKYSYSKIAFAIYFLGLFNLMFNWGHHIYTLPTHPYVKHIAYLVSMTELLLFGRIIYLWKSSVNTALKHFPITAYRFLIAADVWVFLTLGLAIAMSIPSFNIYMHGTHVVVGHTMGATIGINTMLLLAFATDILGKKRTFNKWMQRGFWMSNISLFIFWITLIAAGFWKSYYIFNTPNVIYGELMLQLLPYFQLFMFSGLLLVIGLCMIIFSIFSAKK